MTKVKNNIMLISDFSKLQIIPGDSHPNELGHLKMAESLYPKIKNLVVN